MELTKKIGQRLREARHAQDLSLAQLSARTGSLSKSRISNYEQGIRRMGLEEARLLAEALETVTPVYLLCLDDTGPLSEAEMSLLELYRRADDRGKGRILEAAESESGNRAKSRRSPKGKNKGGSEAKRSK